MSKRCVGVLLSALFIGVLGGSIHSTARELPEMRVPLRGMVPVTGEGHILRRERHVIEGRRWGWGWWRGNSTFLINGRWYADSAQACGHWVAGERIKLVAGSWHSCGVTVFYNIRRHATCALQC